MQPVAWLALGIIALVKVSVGKHFIGLKGTCVKPVPIHVHSMYTAVLALCHYSKHALSVGML